MDSRADCISSAGKVLPNQGKTTTRPNPVHPKRLLKFLLRTVKLTAFFILLACLHLSAKTTAQKLSISLKNGSLESLFATIEQKTGFSVFYNAVDIQHSKPVTIDVKDASVEEVLQLSLKGQALTYFIQEKTIFIKKEVDRTVSDAMETPTEGSSQFTGIVKSEAGTPLVGGDCVYPEVEKIRSDGCKGEFVLKNVPDGEYEVEVSRISGMETFTPPRSRWLTMRQR